METHLQISNYFCFAQIWKLLVVCMNFEYIIINYKKKYHCKRPSIKLIKQFF